MWVIFLLAFLVIVAIVCVATFWDAIACIFRLGFFIYFGLPLLLLVFLLMLVQCM